tara:strand:+ start:31 stop:450 length:420 start_codon:yes stop_codon:yes gene_type:complete
MQERLAQLIQHLGISSAAFAEKIGIQRSSISHVISGRNKPSLEFMHKISLAYPDISLDWLITGKGNMLKSDDKKASLSSESSLEQMSMGLKAENIEEPGVKPQLKEEKRAKKTPASGKHIKKLILVYDDNTFEEVNPRN